MKLKKRQAAQTTPNHAVKATFIDEYNKNTMSKGQIKKKIGKKASGR